jgi:methionine sulfoxide reductase heme-binding subunit
MRKILANRWTKAAAFCLCLTPVATLVWRAWEQDLSANPVEFITHATGDWALRFLLITLAVTPARRVFGLPQLAQFRRMLGLFSFENTVKQRLLRTRQRLAEAKKRG